jgi:integrase
MPSTIKDYMIIVCCFYKWFTKKKDPDILAEFVPPHVNTERLHPKDVLTWEDIIRLSRAGSTPIQIAIPQVLYDLGSRAEEFLTPRIQDVELIMDGRAIKIHINKSKTDEGLRSPLIVRSAPALMHYLQAHPKRGDPYAPLWVMKSGKPLSYGGLRKMLQVLKARSELEKPVNPHSFRKSSATEYAHNENFNPLEIKQRFGWEKSSRMLDIYCRIDEGKVNDKVMQQYGLKEREKVKEEIKDNECGWCKYKNPLGETSCFNCGRPLGLRPEEIETQTKWDMFFRTVGEKMMQTNPNIKEQFEAAALEVGSKGKRTEKKEANLIQTGV